MAWEIDSFRPESIKALTVALDAAESGTRHGWQRCHQAIARRSRLFGTPIKLVHNKHLP